MITSASGGVITRVGEFVSSPWIKFHEAFVLGFDGGE